MSRFFLISFCMVLLGAATSMAVSVDTTSDLLLHLTYDNATNLGADSSGNGYDCTVANETYLTSTTGVVNGAADFVNSGSSWPYAYLDVPTVSASEVPSSAVTIAAWISLERLFEPDYSATERNTIFSTMAAPNGAHTTKGTGGLCLDVRGVTREFEGETVYSAGYRVCFRGADATGERNQHTILDYTYGAAYETDAYGNITELTENLPVRLDEWIHIAATYDKDTATAALYLDGIKVKDLPVNEAVDIDTDWYRAQVAQFVEGGREFIGEMDDLRIYTRALNEAEVGSLAGLIAGDANNDGKVDGSDVTILAGNWQYGVTGGGATWSMGDFNYDGKVDGSDVTILAGNWQYGVTATAAAVPEPTIMVLLVTAFGSLLIWRRMK